MKKKLFVLFVCIVIFTGFLFANYFTETFDNSTATSSYLNNSFIGVNDILWFFFHSRDEGDYPIDGNGIMLRRADEPSSLSAYNIPGGIKSFSVDTRKAFTGNSQRKLSLSINGNEIATFEPSYGEGSDATIHNFAVDNINISGNYNIELKLYGAVGNQQIVLDNLTIVSYDGESDVPLLPKILTPVTNSNQYITKEYEPLIITGEAEKAKKIFLYVNGNFAQEKVLSDSIFTFFINTGSNTGSDTGLKLNENTLIEVVSDSAGIKSDTAHINIFADTIPPIMISENLLTDTKYYTLKPTIKYNAFFDSSGIGFYNIYLDSNSNFGNYIFDTSPTNEYLSKVELAVDTWFIKIIAVDNAGNISDTYYDTFVINTISTDDISDVRGFSIGSEVIVQGIVTVGISVIGSEFYIQDATAGIAVFDGSNSDFAGAPGDEVIVSGTLGSFNEMLQIINPNIKIISSNNSLPDPVILTTEQAADTNYSDQYQGMLIKIKDLPPFSDAIKFWFEDNNNYTINDGSGNLSLRIINDNKFNHKMAPRTNYDLIGILSRRFEIHRIIPRWWSDFIITDESVNLYYSTTEGLSENELKDALYEIVKDHFELTYTPDIWHAFYITDSRDDSMVWDIYSDYGEGKGGYHNFILGFHQDAIGGEVFSEGELYNREHSFPTRWWAPGRQEWIPYTDLQHIYPVDKYVNFRRSAFPFGLVDNPTVIFSNHSKLGLNVYPGYTGTVYEPIDAYKGDLARTYFYMEIRYSAESDTWDSPDYSMFDGATMKPWAREMLIEWHINDPVSQKEIDRNNSVHLIQGNRNPFIDNPEFVLLIWDTTVIIQDPSYDLINSIRAKSFDDTVTAKGIMTVNQNTIGSEFYIQDATAGISVFGTSNDFEGVAGDEILISGKLGEFNSLLQILDITSVEILSNNNDLPDPIVLTTNTANDADHKEGMLVRINNVEVTSGSITSSGDNNLIINDGSGYFTLRVDRRTDIVGKETPVGSFNVTGILSRHFENLQIKPRSWNDFNFTHELRHFTILTATPFLFTEVDKLIIDFPANVIDEQELVISVSDNQQTVMISDTIITVSSFFDLKVVSPIVQRFNDSVTVHIKYHEANIPENASEDDLILFNYYSEFDSYVIVQKNNYTIDTANKYVSIETNQFHTYVVGSIIPPNNILDIRLYDDEDVASLIGQNVAVEGVVTSIIGREIYIQDETAGIVIDDNNFLHKVGDKLFVRGTLNQFRGLLQIQNASYSVISSDNELPAPIVLTVNDFLTNGKTYEGMLVRFQDVFVLSGDIPDSGSDNIFIQDESSSVPLLIRVDESTNILGNNIPESRFNLIGLAGRFSSTNPPYDGGFQVKPRSYNDFIQLEVVLLKMITSGTPAKHYYLGDLFNVVSDSYIIFEIFLQEGMQDWFAAESGIGRTADDSSNWDWRPAEFYEDGASINKKVRSEFSDFQFTLSDTWYFNARVICYEGDEWIYANNNFISAEKDMLSEYYFFVNSLETPSDLNVVFDSIYSDTLIKLNWTNWTCVDFIQRNAMLVVSVDTKLNQLPATGISYNSDSEIGNGYVLYNDGNETFNHIISVDTDTVYYYYLFTENNGYYSNPVSCSITYYLPSELELKKSLGNILETDTTFVIRQDNADTLIVSASNNNQSGTWTIKTNFDNKGNSLKINRVLPAIVNASDTSNIGNCRGAEGLYIEVKVFDNKDEIITDLINANITLTIDFSNTTLTSYRTTIFKLVDGVWTDVLNLPDDVDIETFDRNEVSRTLSVRLKKLSNFFVNELPVDIAITSPTDTQITRNFDATPILFSGTTMNTAKGDSVEIWISNFHIDTIFVSENDTWSFSYVYPGIISEDTDIILVAKLLSGEQVSYDTITINYIFKQVSKPIIYQPVSDGEIYKTNNLHNINIIGSASNNDTIYLFINDELKSETISTGTWEFIINVDSGLNVNQENTIGITAGYGNQPISDTALITILIDTASPIFFADELILNLTDSNSLTPTIEFSEFTDSTSVDTYLVYFSRDENFILSGDSIVFITTSPIVSPTLLSFDTWYVGVQAVDRFGHISDVQTDTFLIAVLTRMFFTGSPVHTKYLGDKITDDERYIVFGVNQDKWNYAYVGFGQTQDSSDWDWFVSADYSETFTNYLDDGYTYLSADILNKQLDKLGDYYFAAKINVEGHVFYADYSDTKWHINNNLFYAENFITVLSLEIHNDLNVVFDNIYRDTMIKLNWTNWTGVDSIQRNAMLVVSVDTKLNQLPATGVSYNADSEIGNGLVLYNDANETFNHIIFVDTDTVYYYYLFTENNGYYSNPVSCSITYYLHPELEILITSPATGYETSVEYISVKGTIYGLCESGYLEMIVRNIMIDSFSITDTHTEWCFDNIKLLPGNNLIEIRLYSGEDTAVDFVVVSNKLEKTIVFQPEDNQLEFKKSLGNILETDTTFFIRQDNADTLIVSASNNNQSGTWTIKTNFDNKGNSLKINRVLPTIVNVSDTSNIGNCRGAEGLYIEVKVFDNNNEIITDLTNDNITLTIDFSNTTLTGYRTTIFKLVDGVWTDILNLPDDVDIETFYRNEVTRTLSVRLKKLSMFFVNELTIDLTRESLDKVVIVPNPFRPYDGNRETGEKFVSGYNHTGIQIINLTDNATVKIYDILGRKVRKLTDTVKYGIAVWDGKSYKGKSVRSGTYLIVISDEKNTVVRKLAIIR